MAQTIGYLKAVHVLVATPEHLTELLEDKQFPDLLNDLRAFAVDEVDLCFQVWLNTLQIPDHMYSVVVCLSFKQINPQFGHILEAFASQGWGLVIQSKEAASMSIIAHI